MTTGKLGGGKPPVKPPLKKHASGDGARSSSAAKPSARAPESTFEEVRYIKHLIDDEVPIKVRLRNNEEVAGTVEYYDHSFIRITRDGAPNLFIFKHDIKYIYEV